MRRDFRRIDSCAASGERPQRRDTVSRITCLARWVGLLALAILPSCAGREVRPESALIVAPPEEVWNVALDLLREREFKIETQDATRYNIQGTKEIIIRTVTDRATPTTTQKIIHKIDLSVRPQGDGRSTVEIIYRIDKIVEEDSAFHFLNDLRDRVALTGGGATRSPSRR